MSTRWNFGPCIQLQLAVFIAPLVLLAPYRPVQATVASVPTSTLQASTGHHSFSYVVGKGEVRVKGVFSWL